MNPRLRRLIADGQRLKSEFAGHPYIQVEPLGYEPAESFRITFRLKGVDLDAASRQPNIRAEHVARLTLGAGYPTMKPFVVMETPIFHPNFGIRPGEEICLGDFWTPAQPLSDIIVKIGQMIQYQVYNVKSPLNAEAARWVAANEDKSIFPIGTVDLFQAEPEIVIK